MLNLFISLYKDLRKDIKGKFKIKIEGQSILIK